MSRSDETKRLRTSDVKKVRNSKKTRSSKESHKSSKKSNKFKNKHPKAYKRIKLAIIVLVILGFVGLGVLAGAFIGIFGEELKIDEASLVVGHENSTVYDADGNYIATLSGGTKRKSISLSEMGDYLPKAYVAIEDERFYEHSGVDILRTARATLTYLVNRGSSKFGGSTITQQVIKNITNDKEKSSLAGAMRKVKEISKAVQVEQYLSKDQILELYLNLIFVGGDDINGVELGSIYYFNKHANELSIAECAYMAGINNSPNLYKPFETYEGKEDKDAKLQKMKERIDNRTKTVLSKMEELSYISKDQYDEAIAEVDAGLKFQKGEAAAVTTKVSYVTEAAIEQILDQIISENEDMNRDMAEMALYSSGYKIYTTQKTDIQNVVEAEVVKDKYFTSSSYKEKNKETGEMEKITQYSMPTMVIVDHKTGSVVAAATATGDKENRIATTTLGYMNYPSSMKKQTGSSMKPISVIAPGLESGKISGATVFDDSKTTWPGGWSPKDYDRFRGLINMRTAIEVSANVPHAKALSVVGTEMAVEFCEKVGLGHLEAEGLSLALGGLHEGVSPAQMAGAYAAIANDGTYNSLIYYTKVENKAGDVVFQPNQTSERVMSEANAYVEKDILKQPVLTGTATYCKVAGMDVSAKTGTTNDDNDRWLCGFTPYYTAACWYGYNKNSTVVYSGNPAGKMWAAVMQEIHKDLDNAKFEEPEGVVRKAVCSVTGCLPREGCPSYTEVFNAENVPSKVCSGHAVVRVCQDSGLLSAGGCPNVVEQYAADLEYENGASWTTEHSAGIMPEGYCPLHAGGGGPGYVTNQDQFGFQAATDADAMGITGPSRDDFINSARAAGASGGTTYEAWKASYLSRQDHNNNYNNHNN